MSQNKFLVPVGDLKVRHPQGGYLAPTGDHVVVDSYWRKRISDGSVIEAYEIHHGIVGSSGGEPFVAAADGSGEGCRVGAVAGTVWHGVLENDAFRRRYLAEVAHACGRRFVVASDISFAAERAARLDRLGDLVADHLDLVAVEELLAGPRPDLPHLRLSRSSSG